ncbi:hypothetical protein GCM10007874_22440 [Labrys miyagiensis]|uniref:Uncharacterized protein n=1 Tax=Labrys miyagiensis TaxID=346912 RepID=A0ABQ6CLT4_9HYPH|nr:hypothetical protein GCM10007874_22440 [Labrys miyagiensis]
MRFDRDRTRRPSKLAAGNIQHKLLKEKQHRTAPITAGEWNGKVAQPTTGKNKGRLKNK